MYNHCILSLIMYLFLIYGNVSIVLEGSVTILDNSITVTINTVTNTVNIKMIGTPITTAWTGFAFRNTGWIMNNAYAIILSTNVYEYTLGNRLPGDLIAPAEVTITNDTNGASKRWVEVTRDRTGTFDFPSSPTDLHVLGAVGQWPIYDSVTHASKGTATMTLVETVSPTTTPTNQPSILPTTKNPTNPTELPTDAPTEDPTELPTEIPTDSPTVNPTIYPSKEPTTDPTTFPTEFPTETPTENPTGVPTVDPTYKPTTDPSPSPTFSPTRKPTPKPAPISFIPTKKPSNKPTKRPTINLGTTEETATKSESGFEPIFLLWILVGFTGLGLFMIIGVLINGKFQQIKSERKKNQELANSEIFMDENNDVQTDDLTDVDNDVQMTEFQKQTDAILAQLERVNNGEDSDNLNDSDIGNM